MQLKNGPGRRSRLFRGGAEDGHSGLKTKPDSMEEKMGWVCVAFGRPCGQRCNAAKMRRAR